MEGKGMKWLCLLLMVFCFVRLILAISMTEDAKKTLNDPGLFGLAKITEFPHHVLIGHEYEAETFIIICGGSIVSPKLIITAANCLYEFDENGNLLPIKSNFSVSIGKDITLEAVTSPRIPFKNFGKHPDYNGIALKGDLAWIALDEALTFNGTIKPINLPLNDTEDEGFGTLSVKWPMFAGVGSHTIEGGLAYALYKIAMPKTEIGHCEELFDSFEEKSMFCCGIIWATDKGSGTCEGESGGALVAKRDDGSSFLMGVHSRGHGCFHESEVFMRISFYKDWIKSLM